jgi:calcium-dependent protein kinase
VHLVMEVCNGGVLLERIEKEKYSEKYIVPIVRSILRFISQCHAKGFIYRDVKPDNFLFQTKDPDSHLKATDFGLSIKHWPHERKLTSRSGTPAYMAPELVMQSYDEKCDVWSVGMLTYQMLTGRFPYWEDVRRVSLTDVWKAILTDDINWSSPELKQLSRPAIDFLQSLLQRDPANRPSAQECLEHLWVVDDTNAADLPLEGSVVQRLQRFSTYGLLKQMVLMMIVDDMAAGGDAAAALKSQPSVGVPADVVEGLQSLFNELDVDKSGSITMSELSQGLRKQGYNLTDDEIEQLMRKVDANHDGDVSINEFMATLLDWNLIQESQGWQSYVDRAFDNLNKDGDGFIRLEELVELLPTVMTDTGRPVSAEERLTMAKQMLREADTNGDGKISRDEFSELLKEHQAPDSLSFYDDRLTRSI